MIKAGAMPKFIINKNFCANEDLAGGNSLNLVRWRASVEVLAWLKKK
jgi:hypothetical protein